MKNSWLVGKSVLLMIQSLTSVAFVELRCRNGLPFFLFLFASFTHSLIITISGFAFFFLKSAVVELSKSKKGKETKKLRTKKLKTKSAKKEGKQAN